MKITKSALKQIIKEELNHLEETEQYPTYAALQGGPKTVEEAVENMEGAIKKAQEATRYPNTMGEVITALGQVSVSFMHLKKMLKRQNEQQ
jgi:hypothetical protein